MAFQPDILVTESGSPHVLMIIESKLFEDKRESDSQLQRYMWEMSCPVGLLVFPRHLRIYRNRFTGYSDDSVQLIGSFPSPSTWQEFEERKSGFQFERAVQHWLETLRTNPDHAQVPPETQKALVEYVIPALISGEIQAAGPRTMK